MSHASNPTAWFAPGSEAKAPERRTGVTTSSVIVAEAASGEQLSMPVKDGARVVEACDAHDAPIPFCCRSAACGTCRVEVLEGADRLEPAERDELELLQVFDADPSRVRLACQLRLRPVRARVHLRAIEP